MSKTPRRTTRSSAKRSSAIENNNQDDISLAIEKFQKAKKENEAIGSTKDIIQIRRNFKKVCHDTKLASDRLTSISSAKKAGTTRSGAVRTRKANTITVDGKWTTKGMDEANERFDESEIEYLKKELKKIKEVRKLSFDMIRYLIIDVYLEELKRIQTGDTDSYFHRRYLELKGHSKDSLVSEIKTSLFTDEQLGYIHGLLQGAFRTTLKDDRGDIKHSEINYLEVVILAEVVIRLVRFVYDYETTDEAYAFMVKSSMEASGF